MHNPYTTSGHGKIARLPHSLREQLNQRLLDGQTSKTILPWLNALPEVKTLLAAEFASQPINRQNLFAWKKGGFRDWLIRRDSLEFIQNLENDEALGAQPLTSNFADKLARWLTLQYAAATRSATAENPKAQWNRLREFCADICRLRRGDLYSQLLQTKRDWLALQEKNADFLREQQFTEWAKERGFAEPKFTRGLTDEVIEELQNKLQLL